MGGWLLAACMLVGSCGQAGAGDRVLDRHSLVLVVIDSLRADHVGAWGYGPPTTPFLDQLAAQGVVFERAYANSSYAPQSLSSLTTGRLPSSGGSIGLLEAEPAQRTTTLPQRFRRAGFRTGIVTNQALMRGRGFTRGFDDLQIASRPGEWSADDVLRRALDFVDDAGQERFMLYVQFAEPHYPYEPPPELRARFEAPQVDEPLEPREVRGLDASARSSLVASDRFADLVARYDAEIAYVDRSLEALARGLEQRGRRQHTVFAVTSNHGEEFLEHGDVGHAWTLHEEVLHVPLVLHAPGVLAPARVATPVSLVDLVPTFERVFGLQPVELPLDGRPLLGWAGAGLEPLETAGPVIAELVIKERCILRSVIDGEWQYVGTLLQEPPAERARVAAAYFEIIDEMRSGARPTPSIWAEPTSEALYHLTGTDARRDLSRDEDRRLERMRGVLEGYAEYCASHGLSAREATPRAALSDQSAASMLRSLGYL